MNQIFSIKSAAVLCVATLLMCFSTEGANAQCRGGGFGAGYGGGYGARSIGYSSGYRGVSVNRVGGFGPGISVNVGRSVYTNPNNRGGGFYGSGLYGNSFNSLGTPFYGRGHGRYGF